MLRIVMSTGALARRVQRCLTDGRREDVGDGANGTPIRTRPMEFTWSLDELRERRERCAADTRQLMARVAALRSTFAEVIVASDEARSIAASQLAERQVLLDHLRAGLQRHDGTTARRHDGAVDTGRARRAADATPRVA